MSVQVENIKEILDQDGGLYNSIYLSEKKIVWTNCVYVGYYFLKKLCEEFLEDRKQMERLWRRVVGDRRPESRRRGARQSGLGLREAVGGRVRK